MPKELEARRGKGHAHAGFHGAVNPLSETTVMQTSPLPACISEERSRATHGSVRLPYV